MPKKFRRNHNHKHIKQSKAYAVDEICATLKVHSSTVYSWLRNGLKFIEGSYPKLIHGSELIDYLIAAKNARKVKCAHDEIYCFKCQAARTPNLETLSLEHKKEKTINMKALCAVCGTQMFKTVAIAALIQINNLSQSIKVQLERLIGSSQRTSNTKTNEV